MSHVESTFSASIVNLAKALFKFQCSIGNIGKDATNPFHKNKYASLTNILDGINSALAESNLIVIQNPGSDGDAITMETILMHSETGEFMSSQFSMTPAKRDPQAIGSCITYMRRYALTSILKLNVDDDDGNEASNAKNKTGTSPATAIKLSAEAQEIKNRMELSETMDELKSLGLRVKEEISSSNEKEVLLTCYKQASNRIRLMDKE